MSATSGDMRSSFWKAPMSFNYYYFGPGRLNEEERKEIVVLLDVLPDDVNVGYHDYDNLIIEKLNGKVVNSFKEFVQTLHHREGQYTILETESRTPIILNNTHIDAATQEILKRNNIPARFSDDVGQWLNEQSPGAP